MKRPTVRELSLSILFVFFFSTLSHAHKVRIFAWEENSTIKVETKFSGGKGVKEAVITVINKQDKTELLSGTTDSLGFFSFPIPEIAKNNRYDLDIVVESGDGHKNSWHLDAADYLHTAGSVTPPVPLPPRITPKTAADHGDTQKVPAYVVSEEQLSRIIESTLDRKLAPIKRSLASQQDSPPSIQDILGGIGYILGFAGIAAYFKSQKKQHGAE